MFLAIFSYGHNDAKGKVDYGKCGVRILGVFKTQSQAEKSIRKEHFSGSKLVTFDTSESSKKGSFKSRAYDEGVATGYQVVEVPKTYKLWHDGRAMFIGTLEDMKRKGEDLYKAVARKGGYLDEVGKLTWDKYTSGYELYDKNSIVYGITITEI